MKTAILLLGLVTLVLASVVPHQQKYQTMEVDADFVEKPKKILGMLQDVERVHHEDEYHRIGKDYDIAAKINNYTSNQTINFQVPKAISLIGNYWQNNADHNQDKVTQKYQRSYEIVGRQLLGAAPKPSDNALDFYQSSLRDPAIYQLYSRIIDYFIKFKEYLEPYTSKDLQYNGVEITDVKVDKLVTYFEYYREPLIDRKYIPFTVTIDVKFEKEQNETSMFKIFLGPKYNSEGIPVNMEESWLEYFVLDWFPYQLKQGLNKIVRNSDDFITFKDDSIPLTDIYKLLDQGKSRLEYSDIWHMIPKRLMLPKGNHAGFPFQLFIIIYPCDATSKESSGFDECLSVNKPFGFPLDRPVVNAHFKQPNMYFKDV